MNIEQKRVAELEAAKSIIDAAKGAQRQLTDDERDKVRSHMKTSEGYLAQMKQAAEDGKLRDELGDALKDDTKDDGGGVLRKFTSIGDAFVKSDAYLDALSAVKSGSRYTTRAVDTGLDLKALTTTTAGLNVGGVQQGPLVSLVLNRPVVADLFAQGTLSASVLTYLRESAATNAAAAVAESGVKPASDLTLTRVEHGLSKIATVLDVPDELLEDLDAARSYIDGRLILFIQQEEEDQVLNGSGVAPNVRGLLNTSGIQTGAATAEADNLDAFYRAITSVRQVAQLEPDGIVVNPTDYQTLRLTKDGNSQYYGGGPFAGPYGTSGGVNDPGLWGLRTIVTPAVAAGTAVVGAFKSGGQVFRKGGITVDSTNSDGDKFRSNISTVRAEERIALAIYRPAAFYKLTLSAL